MKDTHRVDYVTPCYDKLAGSPIKEVSLVGGFPTDDTLAVHLNLVGGAFHRAPWKPVCCGKDYSDQSSRKQD